MRTICVCAPLPKTHQSNHGEKELDRLIKLGIKTATVAGFVDYYDKEIMQWDLLYPGFANSSPNHTVTRLQLCLLRCDLGVFIFNLSANIENLSLTGTFWSWLLFCHSFIYNKSIHFYHVLLVCIVKKKKELFKNKSTISVINPIKSH